MPKIEPEETSLEPLVLVRPAKWSLIVVLCLKDGNLRFSELQRQIGSVTQKALTKALKELERDGFVLRTAYPTIPPRVEYELTEIGWDLLKIAESLRAFAKDHQEAVIKARQNYDNHSANS